MKKIISLKILDNYRVWLRFNDGVEGEVDFSLKPRTGVFTFWNNYDNFRKARIDEADALMWNDQIDFCPDSLWLQVTGLQEDLDDLDDLAVIAERRDEETIPHAEFKKGLKCNGFSC